MTDDMRRLSIVRLNFSSANQILDSRDVDDQTRQVTLKWSPDVRKKITTIRNKHVHLIKKPALNFYGLNVIRDTDRAEVTGAAEAADAEMKTLDASLGASVIFIPLYVEAEAKGQVYQQVLGAIQGRIYSELLSRLTELAGLEEVPKRSRTALIGLVDRLKRWNVLDDPSIEQTLNEMKLSFQNDVIKPVMQDVQKELDALKSRGAFLELGDEEAA